MHYYYFPQSHWSRIISLCLAEKGLETTRHVVDIRRNESMDPDYMRLNPKGVVPTLVDGEKVVCNGPTIAAHLDSVTETTLVPTDAGTRAWATRLEDFPTMHLSYSIWVLGLHGERSSEILDDKVDRCARYADEYPDLRSEYLRKKAFFEEFRAGVYDASYREKMLSHCTETLENLSSVVSSRDWIGPQYSFADAIATSILYRLSDLALLDFWRESHPLADYFERLKARPSYQEVWVEDPLISR